VSAFWPPPPDPLFPTHRPCPCPCHGKDNIPDLQAVEIKKSTLDMENSASVKCGYQKEVQLYGNSRKYT